MSEHLIPQLQKHLESLATLMDCELVQGYNIPGMMYVEFGYVEGPELAPAIGTSQYPDICSQYYTNLHELGHYVNAHTQGRPTTSRAYKGNYVNHRNGPQWYFDNGVLKSEAEAWEWALNLAQIPPTDACRKFMWNTCMGSYYAGSKPGAPVHLGNGDRDYVAAVWDEPDVFFWAVRERMLKELVAEGSGK